MHDYILIFVKIVEYFTNVKTLRNASIFDDFASKA